MTDTMEKLTARQIEALDAVLHGQGYWMRRDTVFTDTLRWRSARVMGGSVHRMGEALREAGYIVRSPRFRLADDLGLRVTDLPKMPEALEADNGGLSIKGLQALDAHLRSGRRYDPTDNRLAMIKDQLAKRAELDAAYNEFLQTYRDRSKVAYDRKRDAQRKAWVADTRLLLTNAGLGPSMYELADDADVLQLAKGIAGAEHSLNYVRFMDDADLSAELDAAEKKTTTPGTIGDIQRSELVQAIRAEFKRRAEAA